VKFEASVVECNEGGGFHLYIKRFLLVMMYFTSDWGRIMCLSGVVLKEQTRNKKYTVITEVVTGDNVAIEQNSTEMLMVRIVTFAVVALLEEDRQATNKTN
jgi:hypothetical protein